MALSIYRRELNRASTDIRPEAHLRVNYHYTRAGKGLTGPLSIRKLAGAFAVVERRADVPPVEFGSLKKHQEVVARLARQVPAILPVRFGTLLDDDHLDEATSERDDEIAEAFDLVRNRVQFTWRVVGGRRSGVGGRKAGNAAASAKSRSWSSLPWPCDRGILPRYVRPTIPTAPASTGHSFTILSPDNPEL